MRFHAKKYVPVCARGFAACTAACATGTLLITAGGLPVYSISRNIITMPPRTVHIESACGSNQIIFHGSYIYIFICTCDRLLVRRRGKKGAVPYNTDKVLAKRLKKNLNLKNTHAPYFRMVLLICRTVLPSYRIP